MGMSRREVLQRSVAAGLATTLGIASWMGRLPSAAAQTSLGPDDVLIAGAVKQGQLKVVAAYYDLATGVVTLLG